MKKRFFIVFFLLILCFSFLNTNFYGVYADEEKIYLGGMPAGFSVKPKGVFVVGVSDIVTDLGVQSPCKDKIVLGDIILEIDGKEVTSASDVASSLKDDNDKLILLNRKNDRLYINVKPCKDLNGDYKLGIFIRDNINGIGTITYIKGNKIGCLGHPIINENGAILDIVGGNLCGCDITSYISGERGRAGELHGIMYDKEKIGNIEKNLPSGVFCSLDNIEYAKNLTEIKVGNAKMGNAEIYTTINGNTPKKYSISIIKVDEEEDTKNFVIKITDKELISCTGGILQGMSGSPIIQNGFLVGAITHVFINDPSRGFGISIYKMLDN